MARLTEAVGPTGGLSSQCGPRWVVSMQAAPHASDQRDEHADPDGTFKGQDDEDPFQPHISSHGVSDDRNRDQHDDVGPGERGNQHHSHPQPIGGQKYSPSRGNGFAGPLTPRVGPALDLFNPHQAFAHHQLNQFQNEENRGGEGDDGNRIHGESKLLRSRTWPVLVSGQLRR